MKRVIATQHSSGKVLGVTFAQEARGKVFVGVAVVDDETAERFQNREPDFEVEDLDAGEVSHLPAELPLLAPQRSALARAGITTVEELRAYDWENGERISGVGPATVTTIRRFLGLEVEPPKDPPADSPKTPAGDAPKDSPADPPQS